MKLKEAIVMQISEADLKTLWEHFNLLEEEDYIGFEVDYDKIRFGYRVRFEISDLWTDRVYIKGNYVHVTDPDSLKKKRYKRQDFITEKTTRKTIIRQRLYENMASEGVLEGR